MKKLFLAMIVCAGFCACSNDDVVVTTTPSDYSREAAAYLTVNIKDVNSGTRATAGNFAYGTTDEQVVNNAYFYFYDDSGNYMANGAVTGGVSGTASGDPGDTGTNTSTNIEWNSGTLVAVYGLDADEELPTQMLTVLNKPTSVNLERQSLTDALATLASTPYGNSDDTFVMSTSVYGGTAGAVCTTALTEDDFALEPINLETDYADGGVAVYVERLAAKVGVNDGITSVTAYNANNHIYPASETLLENFPMGAPTPENSVLGGLAIQLQGFDVDGVARDAYLVKNVATDWTLSFTWNDASDYRSYWAESPNYGVEQTYPTSSNGNTATDEGNSSTWLNEYLRYVDLKSAVDIGSTTYCGENTNTTTVLGDSDNSGITNVIVKAQFGDYNPNNTSSPFTGIDLVEFHGEYYTAADFCQKCVDDVVNYDFTVLVDEVITALKDKYEDLGTYLDQLNNAVIHDHIYKTLASVTEPTASDISAFGGEMLSLYNDVDGYVKIYYNMTTPPQWGTGTSTDPFVTIDQTMADKYPAKKIVYNTEVDLDNYNFWFHVDNEAFQGLAGTMLQLSGLLKKIGDEYYMPIDNSISFTTQAMGDSQFAGGHTYTTRNFLLRTITVEADGIDTEFGSHEPNFFKGGLMYYHVPIEHLGTSSDGSLVEAQYGIVRNHWYNITITSLENLGRGIADENEVIVPLPEVDYYYLGADINILSWKMVNQSVGF